MKFLATFALLVCAAYGAVVPVAPAISTEWTQAQLSEALNDPATDPALLPLFEQAFNQMMDALWAGTPMETVTVSIPMDILLKPEPQVPAAPAVVAPAPAISAEWTQAQLSEALNDPTTDPAILPILEQAFNQMMDALWAGTPMETVTVSIPMDLLLKPEPELPAAPAVVAPAPAISTEWTQAELSEALNDPATDPALLPILEAAFNQMMDALWAGSPMETVTVSIPMDLLLKPEPEVPAVPVEEPTPVAPVAPAAPAAPETPSAPAPATAPLVQIILNINQKAQDSPASASPAMVPEAVPEQVQVVEEAVNQESVIVVDEAVNVVDNVFEPITIDKPIIDINPIDVVAVSPAEINPVDIISPMPVVQPAQAGGIIV